MEQAMVVPQSAAILCDFPNKSIALLSVVMQMYFHVADAQSHNLRYTI
jgi:hypothetical protein